MTTAATATKVFADRIGRIEVSATMAVTAEAAKLRAQGAKLVDFGAGEPHFATPRHIKDAAIDAIESNFTRYTVVSGIPEVRKAIVERHACDFGSELFARRSGLHHRRQARALQRHSGARRSRRRSHPARPLLGLLQGHHPVRRRQGRLPRNQRGGKFPHHRRRHREPPSRRAPRPSSSIRPRTLPAPSSPPPTSSASCGSRTNAAST